MIKSHLYPTEFLTSTLIFKNNKDETTKIPLITTNYKEIHIPCVEMKYSLGMGCVDFKDNPEGTSLLDEINSDQNLFYGMLEKIRSRYGVMAYIRISADWMIADDDKNYIEFSTQKYSHLNLKRGKKKFETKGFVYNEFIQPGQLQMGIIDVKVNEVLHSEEIFVHIPAKKSLVAALMFVLPGRTGLVNVSIINTNINSFKGSIAEIKKELLEYRTKNSHKSKF